MFISYEGEGGIEVQVAVKYTTSSAKTSGSSCNLFHYCKAPVSLTHHWGRGLQPAALLGLDVHQLRGHGGLGVFALKMLLEGLGVWHHCLEEEHRERFNSPHRTT